MPKAAGPRRGEGIYLSFDSADRPRYRVRLDSIDPATGKRVQPWATFDTLTAAREAKAAHRADKARGQHVALDRRGGKQTFEAFAKQVIDSREASGKLRPNTAATYRSALSHANAAFGPKPLAKVTERDIQDVLDRIAEGGKSKRLGTSLLFVLRPIFREAERRHLIARDPSKFCEPSGRAAKTRSAMSPSQAATLRAHLAGDRLYACWLLTLIGLRRSEILGLRWSDIDLVRGTLKVQRGRVLVGGVTVDGETKTKRGKRTLPLADAFDLLDALRTLRKDQLARFGAEHARTGHVAVDEFGNPLRPERYSKLWREHCEAAGIGAFTLHEARHSAVTTLRDAGVPDHVIAAIMGHSEDVLRDNYSHALIHSLSAGLSALTTAYAVGT